jgi:hypothetical protein
LKCSKPTNNLTRHINGRLHKRGGSLPGVIWREPRAFLSGWPRRRALSAVHHASNGRAVGRGDWVPVEKAAGRDANSPLGEGIWRVGADIAPGTWKSSGEGSCYWARLSGFGGTLDHIIANENAEGQAIVQIGEGDAGFKSAGCGDWTRAEG